MPCTEHSSNLITLLPHTEEGIDPTSSSTPPSSPCCSRHSSAPSQVQLWEQVAGAVLQEDSFPTSQADTSSLPHATLLLGRAQSLTRSSALGHRHLPESRGWALTPAHQGPRTGSHRGHDPADGGSSHVFSFWFFYQRHAQILESEAHPFKQWLLHIGPALRKLCKDKSS